MFLPDREIASRLDDGSLEIEPLDDPELQIQPASVDLRLGGDFLTFKRSQTPSIHPTDESSIQQYVEEVNVNRGEEFIVHPGEFVLGTTVERVAIPPDTIGFVQGRSSIGRVAIVVHATAGIVDPGWVGDLTLEISNLGVAPVALKAGMRICQLLLSELTETAAEPYGERADSKYQGQTGPTPSRSDVD